MYAWVSGLLADLVAFCQVFLELSQQGGVVLMDQVSRSTTEQPLLFCYESQGRRTAVGELGLQISWRYPTSWCLAHLIF